MPNARIPWGGGQTTRRPAYGAALHDHGLRFLQGFAPGLADETFPRTEPPNTGFRTKRAQREMFLDKTDRVMPWAALQALIEPRDMTTLKFRCLLERPGARLRPRPSPPRAGPGRPARHAICRCTTPGRANSGIGMKAPIGVDGASGLVHAVTATSANVDGMTAAGRLADRSRNAAA